MTVSISARFTLPSREASDTVQEYGLRALRPGPSRPTGLVGFLPTLKATSAPWFWFTERHFPLSASFAVVTRIGWLRQ